MWKGMKAEIIMPCVGVCVHIHVCIVRARKSRGLRSERWLCLDQNREILWELSNVIKKGQ